MVKVVGVRAFFVFFVRFWEEVEVIGCVCSFVTRSDVRWSG